MTASGIGGLAYRRPRYQVSGRSLDGFPCRKKQCRTFSGRLLDGRVWNFSVVGRRGVGAKKTLPKIEAFEYRFPLARDFRTIPFR